MIYTSYYDQQVLNEIRTDTNTVTNASNTNRSVTKSSKQLPEKAVHLMNTWYAEHEDNPYPNRNDLDYLATNGGIKESQVKAWFSNKRNRTQNTHPKRARRYLVRNQTQQNSLVWNEPQKIHVADELEQRARIIHQQQQQIHLNTQLSSIPPTNLPWLPSNSYDYYHSY
ncbi:unnamed protein product [Adineta steineri]|uniref:Homeobox domain-containing protein n=1 Tax=Adineta steineri TaxID=433720 RepID=A0A815GXM3_9BILA|nr:unnamed protein product [Adineta steineri]CAF1344094.1 unnamed protein product [Adineta steineri]CAF3581892.1 unnamed protein product [Adineta steineri]CAF3678982.1 unnamed protein product [Adineta steineri]